MAQRVLITGGKGQLGTALDAVLGADSSLLVTQADLPDLDVTKPDSLMRTFESARPDIVYHCAAMTDVDGCERDPRRAREVNDKGTFHVAAACRKVGAILVYFSTDFVFDGTLGRPYAETERPNPLSAYGASKLEGERHAALAGEHVIIRTSWLFGGRRGSFVTRVIDRARAGGPISMVDDQAGSPTYAPDLAEGAADLIKAGGRGIYHVANSGSCTRYEFAKAILASAGMAKVALRPAKTAPAEGVARRPASAPLDCTRFAALTGAPLRSWNEALAEYMISAGGPLA